MGLILKPGKTFSNPYDGETTEAYTNVKRIVEIDAKRKYAEFVVTTYTEKSVKDTKLPLKTSQYMVGMSKDGELEPEVFDLYFSDEALQNRTIYQACYAYIATLPEWEDWESDEI